MGTKEKNIFVKGARLHNLKNIDVKIPHNKLTVITGVSGSGKSSLAFDTIYAEGQRRFVESLSAYARQFLERMVKPDVDSITGIPPAIAIEQKPTSRNPRSTVGTTTEIYDYLRLLYGRIGTTFCRECGSVVKRDTPTAVVDDIFNADEGDKIYIVFPFSDKNPNLSKSIKRYKNEGFFRIYDKKKDNLIELDENLDLSIIDKENHFVLVDRLVLNKDDEMRSRLTDSVETGFRSGGGRLQVINITKNITKKFSKEFECAACDILYHEPEPRLFSFNNPFGACPHCQGFGRTIGIDEDIVIPDVCKSIKRGAIHPFSTEAGSKFLRLLIKISNKYNIDTEKEYKDLSDRQKAIVWDGIDDYPGINGYFKMLEEKSYKMHYRIILSRYRGYTTCKACGGSRIRTSARQVFINGSNIPKLVELPLNEVKDFVEKLTLSSHERELAETVIRELLWRLGLLVDIGLSYLTLSRLTHTLSGGEAQRINLSTALGSSLVGTLYVLDEPSIGMHPRDTARLMNILFKLRNLGNTVVVVEHDPDIIRQADTIIEMGPLAGEQGGNLIFSGVVKDMLKSDSSLTGKYLSGKIKFPEKKSPENSKSASKKIIQKAITILNPRKHNLVLKEVSFPLNCITVITGVSGSGKSTLIHEVLFDYLQKIFSGYSSTVGNFEKIEGLEHVDSVQLVDQSSIGKSSRSTPATYTKAFDAIRDLFSQTQMSKQMGWKPGWFSFNVSGGRCETCEGEGEVTVDMQFLPDVHLECEACKGTRYKKETRNVLFNGKSIVDVLSMTIDEAIDFFKDHKRVINKLITLQKVGLGYLRLGQPSNVLSGGESQRVKLAAHLEQKLNSKTLFIFDEPTTGLHLHDISKLIQCFRELVNDGHSVLIIEHNLHIISIADWIVDLGPEAGNQGGDLVAQGTQSDIMKCKASHTGVALKEFYKLG